MIKLSRRRWAILSAAVSAVIVVALFLPTVIGGWAPLLHYTCQQASGPETTIYAWVPGLMINTPYGGEAFGNGTVPAGPLSASGGETVYALGESNGSAAWAGFRAEINVSSVQNQTAWGPGQNVPCTAPFAISVSYWGGEVLGGPLLGAGNVSDSQESTSLDHWTYPGDVNLSVSNGFVESNSRSISTCGTGPASNLTSSPQFEVKVPINVGGVRYTLPYKLPIQQAFHYVFPANFGTWQVDNLSAPGGPGGGWAFSYSPCP